MRAQERNVIADDIEACDGIGKYSGKKATICMPNGVTTPRLIRSRHASHIMMYTRRQFEDSSRSPDELPISNIN